MGQRGNGRNRGIIFFFNGKGNENHQLGTGVCVHHRVASTVRRVWFVSDRISYTVLRVKRVEFVSDRMSYTVLRVKRVEFVTDRKSYTVLRVKRVEFVTDRMSYTVLRVKRVEFVTDRMSYTVLRGHWGNIIVLNVHAPSKEKSDDSKDSFYEELEHVYDHFPQCHIKILLGDFNKKLGREDNFKPTIGNENLHQDSNDNGVSFVSFATSKNHDFPALKHS